MGKRKRKAERKLEARRKLYRDQKLDTRSGYHMPGSLSRRK